MNDPRIFFERERTQIIAVWLRAKVEQGVRDKPGLAIKWRHARLRLHTNIAFIRQQFACIDRVGQDAVEHLFADSCAQNRVFDREQRLHPAIQVALHHISAPQVYLLIATIAKVENAAMLEETSDKTSDTDILAHASDARA